MIAGARVEVAGYKKSDTDFVLWKPAAPDEPGWDSPWGRGRPGWHIECSAMSWKHLGEVFDIHGGGIDLIFPHHENEIAQSRCAFGHDVMANVWMHNGFLQVEGEKMSKSTGHFVTINELLETGTFGGRAWPGEVLRLAMLRKHYRAPIDWTVQALEEAEKTLDRWYGQEAVTAEAPPDAATVAALGDDLNTPAAIGELHRAFGDDRAAAVGAARLMGLLQDTPAEWAARRRPTQAVDADVVKATIDARLAARAAKQWAESDRLRDELTRMGVVLKDNKDGTTTWTVAPGGAA
jgi:cysteinyl-tRNA synthetase